MRCDKKNIASEFVNFLEFENEENLTGRKNGISEQTQ